MLRRPLGETVAAPTVELDGRARVMDQDVLRSPDRRRRPSSPACNKSVGRSVYPRVQQPASAADMAALCPDARSGREPEGSSDANGRLCGGQVAVVQAQVVVGVDEVAVGAQLVFRVVLEQPSPSRVQVPLAALVLQP